MFWNIYLEGGGGGGAGSFAKTIDHKLAKTFKNGQY